LASIKALAQVRKLQLPTLQVNIAEKQINMSSGTPQMNSERVHRVLDSET
jgi:hypothetical protein